MKIRNIFINNIQYIYRTLLPEDFLNISEESDFNIFETKKKISMYQKILNDINKTNPPNHLYSDVFYEKVIKNILKICLIEYDNAIFDNTENSKNIQLFLFNNIIISSTKIFKIPPEIDFHSALIIDAIAKRYSKLPIDIIFNKNDYNKLDSYFFNKQICSIAVKHEIENIEKSNKNV